MSESTTTTSNAHIGRARRAVHPFAVMAPLAVMIASLSATAAVLGDSNGDESYVVVKARRVITAGKEDFSPGVIVIEDGKISAVGKDIEYPPSAKVIDARELTVAPGFVHPRSRHGMADYKRGGVHGDQKASDEVFLSAMDFGDLLRAGYTTVCLVPDGEGIPGRASAYHTAGAEEQRLLSDSAYLHVHLRWEDNDKKALRDALKKAKEEIEKVEKARKEWAEKQEQKKQEESKKKESHEKDNPEEKKNGQRTAAASPSPLDDGKVVAETPEHGEGEKKKDDDVFQPPPIDPKYQPLVDLIQHEEGVRMMVQLVGASSLLHLEDVLEPYDELVHALYLATARSSDYAYIVDRLKERKAQVVLRPWIHYLPQTTFRYNLAARLDAAGCEVSVIPHEHERIEYLRVRERLADLVRAGLSPATAVQSLTLNPARAIGLGDCVGSIEKNKIADLVFFDGDPLDPHAELRRVMIAGEIVFDAKEEAR